jgi:hypothetical protein
MTNHKKILASIHTSNKTINGATVKQMGQALYALPFSPLSYRTVRIAQESLFGCLKEMFLDSVSNFVVHRSKVSVMVVRC